MAVLACAALVAPSTAAAAGVVNGNFETGNFQGWHQQHVTEAGEWFVYEGTEGPISRHEPQGRPLQPPPQGRYAATTDESNPDTLILWQDIAVPAAVESRLSLLAYYNSYAPLALPNPDTLSVADEVLMGQPNQQMRIDLIKPTAPLETLDPNEILATLFATDPGSPEQMTPRRFSANLSAFAGQTVRLRIANSMKGELFNAGLDEVALETAPFVTKPKKGSGGAGGGGGAGGRGGGLSVGKVTANRKNGTATVRVAVPAAGLLTAASTAKKHKPLRAAKKRAGGAGTVKLVLKPTAAALRTLKAKHRLRTRVAIGFAANSGGHESATAPVILKLAPRR